jgi:hypothetical protein
VAAVVAVVEETIGREVQERRDRALQAVRVRHQAPSPVVVVVVGCLWDPMGLETRVDRVEVEEIHPLQARLFSTQGVVVVVARD